MYVTTELNTMKYLKQALFFHKFKYIYWNILLSSVCVESFHDFFQRALLKKESTLIFVLHHLTEDD